MSGKVTAHDLMTDEIYIITTYDDAKDATIEITSPSGVRLSCRTNYTLALRLRSTLGPLEK